MSSSSSIPELTPNRTSSSPPSSFLATSDIDIDMSSSHPLSAKDDLCQIRPSISNESEPETSVSTDGDDDAIFSAVTTLLGPVKFWGESPKMSGVLQPGIELLNFDSDSDGDVNASLQDKKGKKKQHLRNSKVRSAFSFAMT